MGGAWTKTSIKVSTRILMDNYLEAAQKAYQTSVSGHVGSANAINDRTEALFALEEHLRIKGIADLAAAARIAYGP